MAKTENVVYSAGHFFSLLWNLKSTKKPSKGPVEVGRVMNEVNGDRVLLEYLIYMYETIL